jgi:NADH dehydrogenase FAD-containing subunit
MAMTTPTRIVIVGRGFAGLYAALELEQAFVDDDRVEITLVDRDNYLLFTPCWRRWCPAALTRITL